MKNKGFWCAVLLLALAAGPSFAQRIPPAPPAPPVPPRAFSFMMAPPVGGPYLGVGLMEVRAERAGELGMEEQYGVEISSVQPDSPADKAGLQRGDIVLRYDGERVRGVEHFVRLVRETPIGREVGLQILRDGAEANLSVKIGKREHGRVAGIYLCGEGEEDCKPGIQGMKIHLPRIDIDIPKPRIVMQSRYLGAELEGVSGQLAEYFGVEEGVLVRSVEKNTPADRSGLQAGDVITSVNGKSVDSPGDIREAIRSADAEEELPLEVMRKQKKQSLKLEARE